MKTTLSLDEGTIEKPNSLAQILEISRSQVICRIAAYISSRDDMNCTGCVTRYPDFHVGGFTRIYVYFKKNDAALAPVFRRVFFPAYRHCG